MKLLRRDSSYSSKVLGRSKGAGIWVELLGSVAVGMGFLSFVLDVRPGLRLPYGKSGTGGVLGRAGSR